ncbi:unnamed protein product [Protopolystoma xenopodis]|uniref:Uncharacterized protein n=1 Tax=Protopolystoma xenopodis TaxID=117903 RepID=A0A3S4ZZT9_9PLAT|nr:unnamed protein product [Protopolystoma xenopodis]
MSARSRCLLCCPVSPWHSSNVGKFSSPQLSIIVLPPPLSLLRLGPINCYVSDSSQLFNAPTSSTVVRQSSHFNSKLPDPSLEWAKRVDFDIRLFGDAKFVRNLRDNIVNRLSEVNLDHMECIAGLSNCTLASLLPSTLVTSIP